MMLLALLTGVLVAIVAGYVVWKFAYNGKGAVALEAPTRRREDARDWQRRFGADSLLASNFLQPTQNEILETLYVLDHLTPRWESEDDATTERHFLNELALTYPTLCRADSMFPLPFAETLAARQVKPAGRQNQAALPIQEAEVAAQREAFRLGRAQINALEQITSSSDVPTEIVPGSLPFRLSEAEPARSARTPWPARFAGVALLVMVAVGAGLLFPKLRDLGAPQPQSVHVFVPDSPELSNAAEPSPAPPAMGDPVAATTSSSLAATPPAMPSTPSPVAAHPPQPPTTITREKVTLDQQIAASQQRAVSKYPTLAVEGSEINLRFVFRYKNLVQEHSSRLLDPTWPEQLAEECATAAGMSPKHNAFAQIHGTPR